MFGAKLVLPINPVKIGYKSIANTGLEGNSMGCTEGCHFNWQNGKCCHFNWQNGKGCHFNWQNGSGCHFNWQTGVIVLVI